MKTETRKARTVLAFAAGAAFAFAGEAFGADSVDWASRCSQAAAAPAERLAGIPGVEWGKLAPTTAVGACSKAAKAQPNDGATWFRYGRGLEKASKIAEAADAYEKSANLGHAGGMNNLGELLASGKGGTPKDYVRAGEAFAKARLAGWPEAEANLKALAAGGGLADGTKIPSKLFGRFELPGSDCSQTKEASKAFGAFAGFEVSARRIERIQDESCAVLGFDAVLGVARLACSVNDPDQRLRKAKVSESALEFEGGPKLRRCR